MYKTIKQQNNLDDHYLNEPNAAWVYPRIAYIKPIQFSSDGTSLQGRKRMCIYKKTSNSYIVETTTSFSPCTTKLTFKYQAFQDIGLECKFNVQIIQDNVEHQPVISSVILRPSAQTINVQYTNTTADKNSPKKFTIKCYNFRFVKENNETEAILPLIRTKEDTNLSFTDKYRYGFDSNSKDIIANGYTNYGLFRRLIPFIKINDTGTFPYIQPPEAVQADTKVVKMLIVRKNISNTLIGSLNLDDTDITRNAHYLSSCYIPSSWATFNYNIISFQDYVKESELSTMTSAAITLSGINRT